MLELATLVAGFVLLIVGGGLLVQGASEIARKFGVSPMIVGLTIVGFGTSAPELVVNTVGALQGATDLAFGNVVGSNISNLALVLGTAALLAPITIQGQLVKREVPLLLLATLVITVMSVDHVLQEHIAAIGLSDSIVLLLLFCVFIYVNVLDILGVKKPDALLVNIDESPLANSSGFGRFQWLSVIGGLALLFVGGRLVVDSAISLASVFDVSETIIGLFVVAIGTSLPELVTSIIAALRGEADLALGNVVGSNLFNSLVVLPVTGLITPILIPAFGVFDLAVSFILTLLLIPIFVLGKARLGRASGALLLVAYFGYALFRISATG